MKTMPRAYRITLSLLSLMMGLSLFMSFARANTLTITSPPPAGLHLAGWNPYVGEAGSFNTSFGTILANGDLVHAPNPGLTGSPNAYMLLTPVLNPIMPPLQQRGHGADFTLTLFTPVREVSILMFDVEDTNTVEFGKGASTVIVRGTQLMPGDDLITFVSTTPFDRIQVHDVDALFPGHPDTYARFQLFIGGGEGAVPEASTWAMMLMGFLALGYAAYRRPQHAARA